MGKLLVVTVDKRPLKNKAAECCLLLLQLIDFILYLCGFGLFRISVLPALQSQLSYICMMYALENLKMLTNNTEEKTKDE